MLFPSATFQCLQCGYKVESQEAIRCPRCFKLLLGKSCQGSCSACSRCRFKDGRTQSSKLRTILNKL